MAINNQRSNLSDEEIIEMYWNRNENAIVETDLKHGKWLFKIAYNALGNSQLSDDCKNDAYFDVWNSIPPMRPKSFTGFLSTVVRRKAINKFKELHAKSRISSSLVICIEELYDTLASNDTVEGAIEASELGVIINDYLKQVSRKNRMMFVGRYYFAESINDIAKLVDSTPSSVYKALCKMRNELKIILQGKGVFL